MATGQKFTGRLEVGYYGVTAADDVDHIIRFEGLDDPLRLDPRSLQSLCRPHHNEKTRKCNTRVWVS